MPNVAVSLPNNSYQIIIEPGLLERVGQCLREVAPHQRCAVLADQTVFELYGQKVCALLTDAGYSVTTACQPSGESHKTLETVSQFYEAMLADSLERGSPVLTLGGGVNGDTAGFVASTYLRGVPFIQVPTTLLAMVDASVGGKVGVNLPQGKNLVGSFYQPKAVLIDPLLLQTLPKREFCCGLAECVKHGVLADADLFSWIELRAEAILALEVETLAELVERNVRIKAEVVAKDEREQGVRAHLNLGHTFGHAIERSSGYGEIRHGEAVSLGMLAAAELAVKLGYLAAEVPERLRVLLKRLSLPITAELAPTPQLLSAMRLDKKVAQGKIRLVLPTELGAVRVFDNVSDDDISWAWEQLRSSENG